VYARVTVSRADLRSRERGPCEDVYRHLHSIVEDVPPDRTGPRRGEARTGLRNAATHSVALAISVQHANSGGTSSKTSVKSTTARSSSNCTQRSFIPDLLIGIGLWDRQSR
jgi:hypothetical protein